MANKEKTALYVPNVDTTPQNGVENARLVADGTHL